MNRDELIIELERDKPFVCTYKGERIEHLVWLLKQRDADGDYLWVIEDGYEKLYDELKKDLLIFEWGNGVKE